MKTIEKISFSTLVCAFIITSAFGANKSKEITVDDTIKWIQNQTPLKALEAKGYQNIEKLSNKQIAAAIIVVEESIGKNRITAAEPIRLMMNARIVSEDRAMELSGLLRELDHYEVLYIMGFNELAEDIKNTPSLESYGKVILKRIIERAQWFQDRAIEILYRFESDFPEYKYKGVNYSN